MRFDLTTIGSGSSIIPNLEPNGIAASTKFTSGGDFYALVSYESSDGDVLVSFFDNDGLTKFYKNTPLVTTSFKMMNIAAYFT